MVYGIRMRHGYFELEGTTIYLLANWELLVFFLAGDCELPYFLLLLPLAILSNYSGHDPTGICNVESIQTDPLYPPVHLCATGYC